jgi:peptide/nickel transport system ATP-binding protein
MSTLHLLPDNAEVTGNILYQDKLIYEQDAGRRVKVSRKARRTLDQRLIDIRWKEIAMVFQGAMNAFNPVKTIRNQINEVFSVHGTFKDLSNFTEEDYVDKELLRKKAHEEFTRNTEEVVVNTTQPSEEEIYQQMVENNLEIFRNGNPRLKRKLLMSNRIEKISRIANFNTAFLDSYPHELSGGMKQRGIITMALALFPRILVADEPTTGLDAISQAKIIKELNALKTNKTVDAMIVISHDVGVVAQLADKVAVMYAGRVMEYGTPDEIFNSPVNPYTYALVNSYPALSKEKKWIEGIPGHVPSLLDLPQGCYFANRCFMAEEICFSAEPPLKVISGNRLTKCHFDGLNLEKVHANLDEPQDQQDYLKPGTPLVAVDRISKYFSVNTGFLTSLFGGSDKVLVHAVDKVSLALKRGGIVGLVGESGSGKSTLGRIMVKAIEPTDGSLFFSFSELKINETYRSKEGDAEDNGGGRPEFLKDMADVGLLPRSGHNYYAFRRESQIIFQDPYDSLNPKRTIFDSLSQAIRMRLKNSGMDTSSQDGSLSKDIQQLSIEALETCDLVPAENYLDRYPHELSGGERQRVCIARAISINPSFLVADEPISMLDVSIRANILNLLKKLRREKNMSILYISHDIASARYISDDIAVMYLGQIVEFGTSEEVIKNPLHPYTKALILSIPDIDPEWISREFKIFGEIGNAINPENRCRFYDRCIYRKEICNTEDPPMVMVDQRYYKCHFTQDQLVENEELLSQV